MVYHISIPADQDNHGNTSKQDPDHKFGYFETCGARPSQEDALAWHTLTEEELKSSGSSEILTPQEIGHRLWTTYQKMDASYEGGAGTTASTTVFDGKGNLITATLADAAAFAAVYGKNGEVLGVLRLNSVTHKPAEPSEHERIEAAGEYVLFGRVNGSLAVSRAIGDKRFKSVTAEASIDITSMDDILYSLEINPQEVGSIQVITTCDGFTDGAGHDKQKKSDHEEYLKAKLIQIGNPSEQKEADLSERLALAAIKDGSGDNVSVAIQTISGENLLHGEAFFLGVYDGHAGDTAAIHVAENIGKEFKQQCALTSEDYAKQEWSVQKHQEVYHRDNKVKEGKNPQLLYQAQLESVLSQLKQITGKYKQSVEKKFSQDDHIVGIVKHLDTILNAQEDSNESKIKKYYEYLNNPSNADKKLKNIDVIKKDNRTDTRNYLKFIAVVAATIFTGILPGMLVMAICYAATNKQPMDLLKSDEGKKFLERASLIKQQPSIFSMFKSYSEQESSDSPCKNNSHKPN